MFLTLYSSNNIVFFLKKKLAPNFSLRLFYNVLILYILNLQIIDKEKDISVVIPPTFDSIIERKSHHTLKVGKLLLNFVTWLDNLQNLN